MHRTKKGHCEPSQLNTLTLAATIHTVASRALLHRQNSTGTENKWQFEKCIFKKKKPHLTEIPLVVLSMAKP